MPRADAGLCVQEVDLPLDSGSLLWGMETCRWETVRAEGARLSANTASL